MNQTSDRATTSTSDIMVAGEVEKDELFIPLSFPSESINDDEDETSTSSSANSSDDEHAKMMTPLPLQSMVVMLCVVVAEGVSGTILLPFVNSLIRSFDIEESRVGYYAGSLTSAFFAAQFVSGLFVGSLSDRVGRRPVMLISLLGNAVAMTMFGFSFALWWVVTARCLNGLLNGNTATVKALLRDISDESNQARAYSIRSAGYAIGMTIGPVIGGMLDEPAEKPFLSPIFSHLWMFQRFPFLLPCLVNALLNLVGFFLALFFLEETMPERNSGPKREEGSQEGDQAKFVQTEKKRSHNENDPTDGKECGDGTSEETNKALIIQSDNESAETTNCARDCASTGTTSMSVSNCPAGLLKYLAYATDRLSFLRQEKDVVLTMILYAILGFQWLMYTEVYVLWVPASKQVGGLSFSDGELAVDQAFGSFCMIGFQVFVYHHLDRRFGSLVLFRLSVLLWIPLFSLTPFVNSLVNKSVVLEWMALLLLNAGVVVLGTSSMASINLLINNVAPPESLGSVNGMAASLTALTRLVAPLVGGPLWAFSIQNAFQFPFDEHLAFVVMSLISSLLLGMTLLCDNRVNRRRTSELVQEGDGEAQHDDSLTVLDADEAIELDTEVADNMSANESTSEKGDIEMQRR